MFDILFGWRKASKCKKLVKRVQWRLKLLKNRRSSIARHDREDLAQLIVTGHHEKAFNRTEQLVNDQRLVSAYELLDEFCEFILVHLSYIRKHKDIPNDINEAVSSLIFASARCGDVPELRGIRKLFGERYGQTFATAAVELFPGNLVNHQIIEKLSAKPVPDDVKQIMFDEITRETSVKLTYVDDIEELESSKTNDGDSQDPETKTKSREIRKEMVAPPYVRAATMPQQRPTGNTILRSNSCPYQQPSHVHPKLPQYDDIAAKFLALNKDHHPNRDR